MPKSKRRGQLDFEEEGDASSATHHIPLPRQPAYSGETNWEAFIKVFLSLAVACGWSEDEKRVRLLSSVAGEAADYLFRTQPEAVFASFAALKSALASRFGERTAPNAFVSKLESRRLNPDESLGEYIADLQRFTLRGFPSADEATREQIALRQFLRGLPDQSIAMSVGMQEPANLGEAQTLVERYRSIRSEHQAPARVRPVAPTRDPDVDHKLAALETRMTAAMDSRIDGLVEMLGAVQFGGGRGAHFSYQRGGGRGRGRDRGRGSSPSWTCYNCGEPGHIRINCPHLQYLPQGN